MTDNSKTNELSSGLQGGARLGATLAQGAIASLSLRVAGIVLIFGLQVLLARYLGVDEYGVYIYVLAWFEILLLLGVMGWETAALRFVPEYQSPEQRPLRWGYIRSAMIVPLVASVAIALAVALSTLLLREPLNARYALVIIAGGVMLPLNTLLQVVSAVLQAMRRVVASQLPQFILRPIVMGAAVLALGWRTSSISAGEAMSANALGALVTLIVAFAWLAKVVAVELRPVVPEYRVTEWLRVSFPMFLIGGCYLLMQRLDVLMLGSMVGTTPAGVYAVASRLSDFSVLGITAVNMVTTPMFAELYASGRKDELQRVIRLGSVAVVCLCLPAILVAWVFGDWFLGLFGEQFREALPALRIILIGPVVAMCMWSVGFLAAMTGNQTRSALLLALAVALNAGLNLVLIPRFGITGAAAASAIALASWHTAMVVLMRAKLGVDPTIFSMFGLLKGGRESPSLKEKRIQ